MSGLNVDNFNLFAKKTTAKPAPRPVVVPATPATIEKEVQRFEAETSQSEVMNGMPVMTSEEAKTYNAEIERFEEIKNTPTLNTGTEQRLAKSIEATLKAPEKTNEAPLRKFETFAAPTFRIPEEHDFELKKIENFIMKNRKKGVNTASRERITTNSVVRALIANFLERAGDLDLSNIDNEEMLQERMEKVFKQKYTKRV